jgi:LuxR family maltose regulon positive regulatory protein
MHRKPIGNRMKNHPVLLTKIKPPQTNTRTLSRPRITDALLEALLYRVTVVQAGAGYGKSTAVMSLIGQHEPLIWYQVSREDADPFVFFQHLLYATRVAMPGLGNLPIAFLESWDGSRGPLPAREVLYRYLNELNEGLDQPALMVLEDIHLAAMVPDVAQALDELISLAPHHLHILLTTRLPLNLPGMSRWMARGQVLQIDQQNLSFTAGELAQLFSERYAYELSEEEVTYLLEATEGWAITLQLVGQSLRSNLVSDVHQALDFPSASLDTLFEILAKEVLDLQPPEIRSFMQATSVLQVMTPEACDALLGMQNSLAMLEKLQHEDLFVLKIGEGIYRYHHIFHRFLRRQINQDSANALHKIATEFQLRAGDMDAAFYHSLKAGDNTTGARILSQYGEELLRNGRYNTLNAMLEAIEPEMLQQHPTLLLFLGDLARLHSRFQEALGWYQQAEALWRERGQMEGISRALRGRARVYLDTVNPSKAEELLQQALRLSDGTADRDTMANLYELLAENKLNAGKGDEAESYQRQAQELRREGPADSQLQIRVLLRTGRLAEARQQLENLVEVERDEPVQQPRAHRETHLLLSLICAMQGEPQAAFDSALEGTRRGEEFNSPFVTAVGYMRQGHALMMLSQSHRYERAIEKFNAAIELSRSLHIPRLRVEAYWGLTRAFGYRGDMAEAQRTAQQGIEIATRAGDEWIASLIRSTLGACYILGGEGSTGQRWLAEAMHGFQDCSDPFGTTSAQLWRCIGWYYGGEAELFQDAFKQVLDSSLRHGYSELLTKPTLLGVPDERRLVPLLLHARKLGWAQGYPDRLLHELNLGGVQLHPGYQLRIESMGPFQVRWGEQKISSSEWKREKSRQLLQVLIANRAAPLDRDQICECLWPGMDSKSAHRNFKVALNSLYQVLEPGREPGSESAYIVREGSTYALRPGADIWLDAEEFDAAVNQAEALIGLDPASARLQLERVFELYRGDFLAEARYETWAAAERERLAVRFLHSGDRLCELYQESDPESVIKICQRVLSVDDCWERAYRFMMRAYARIGDHGRVARTFQTCQEVLRSELDVAPAPQTIDLYRSLIGDQGE